jgi:hypothetical protein
VSTTQNFETREAALVCFKALTVGNEVFVSRIGTSMCMYAPNGDIVTLSQTSSGFVVENYVAPIENWEF